MWCFLFKYFVYFNYNYNPTYIQLYAYEQLSKTKVDNKQKPIFVCIISFLQNILRSIFF